MKHLYQHVFKDGTKVALTVAIEGENFLFAAVPNTMEPSNEAEFELWRDEVVLPHLMDILTPDQIAMFAADFLARGQDGA